MRKSIEMEVAIFVIVYLIDGMNNVYQYFYNSF